MTDQTTDPFVQARERAEARLVTTTNNPRQITEADKAAVEAFTEGAIELAASIELFLDDSRYKSLALTSLEEALTWANKAAYTGGARDIGL